MICTQIFKPNQMSSNYGKISNGPISPIIISNTPTTHYA